MNVYTFACAPLLLLQAPGPRSQANLIEIRVARPTPVRGWNVEKSIDDSTFYVERRVVIGDRDIRTARTAPSTNGLALTIRLTPEAAVRLSSVSGAHIGDRLAIFIERRLNAAPVIMMRIGSAQRITMGVELPPAEAQRFRAAVTARWPAR